MSTKMVHVAFGNYVAIDRIVAISLPSSNPIKRLIQEAGNKNLVIDLTNGRRTKAAIFTSSSHIVLAALEPATITGRIDTGIE